MARINWKRRALRAEKLAYEVGEVAQRAAGVVRCKKCKRFNREGYCCMWCGADDSDMPGPVEHLSDSEEWADLMKVIES